MNQVKFMENVGKVATVTAVAMYVSYLHKSCITLHTQVLVIGFNHL